VHNVGDHQIRINDVGVINDVDALKSMPCDNLDAASSWQNRIMNTLWNDRSWRKAVIRSLGRLRQIRRSP
jgi:hypothetical protein